jgi:hypothetical protein
MGHGHRHGGDIGVDGAKEVAQGRAPVVQARQRRSVPSDRVCIRAAVRLLRQRLAALSPLAVALVACSDATGPTPEDVRAHRANWLAHHLTEYTYIYETRGFFISNR